MRNPRKQGIFSLKIDQHSGNILNLFCFFSLLRDIFKKKEVFFGNIYLKNAKKRHKFSWHFVYVVNYLYFNLFPDRKFENMPHGSTTRAGQPCDVTATQKGIYDFPTRAK
jgi:hypothetical protein